MDTRQRDPAQNSFYASKRWRRIRWRKLREDPWCQCRTACHPTGCAEPAEQVDHIDGNWRNNRPTNHQSLCAPCHSRKTNRDRPKRRRPAQPHPGLVEGWGGDPRDGDAHKSAV